MAWPRSGSPTRVVVNDSFVSPLVERFGDVRVGRGVFVAGNAVLRADLRRRVCLGHRTNVQDNVLVLSVIGRRAVGRGPCGRRSAGAGARTSLAHQAEVVNSRIGDFAFIGFRARLANAVVSDGAFVLHGATIRNVRIPRDRLVGVGQVVTTQAQADALPRKEEAQADFQREVLEVNREFAEAVHPQVRARRLPRRHRRRAPRRARRSTAAGRRRSASGFRREPFARVTGDVRLGDDVTVGRRTSIRADEGAPIAIGDGAEIEDRVTFHALRGTSITIGSGLDTDDNVVFHGPLVVGDDLTIADDAVLFRATVGDGVTIGEGALVVGPGGRSARAPATASACPRTPSSRPASRRAALTTRTAAPAPGPACARTALRAAPIPGTLAPCSSDARRSWRRSVRRPTRPGARPARRGGPRLRAPELLARATTRTSGGAPPTCATAAERAGRPLGMLFDLQGPKLRLSADDRGRAP